jgi:hypothetical protein
LISIRLLRVVRSLGTYSSDHCELELEKYKNIDIKILPIMMYEYIIIYRESSALPIGLASVILCDSPLSLKGSNAQTTQAKGEILND